MLSLSLCVYLLFFFIIYAILSVFFVFNSDLCVLVYWSRCMLCICICAFVCASLWYQIRVLATRMSPVWNLQWMCRLVDQSIQSASDIKALTLDKCSSMNVAEAYVQPKRLPSANSAYISCFLATISHTIVWCIR